MKAKRDAEASASAAAGAYKRYADAVAAATKLAVRADEATDGEDQDVYNGSGCLKAKREAEASADAAADAYKRYANALAATKLAIRADEATDGEDQDVYNGSGCLKAKRSAEASAEAAADAYKRYADALAATKLAVRADEATDGEDQDVYNGSKCLKLKREAEFAAVEARDASAQYEAEMAKRLV